MSRVVRPAERGFALVAVLLVLGLLGIIGAEFAYSMRLEASAMRSWRDGMRAAHLAEAGVEQGLRELSGEGTHASLPFDGILTFYRQGGVALPRLARTRVRLGAGEFSYRITDEAGRFPIPRGQDGISRQNFDRLLQCLGVDKINRDQIIDSVFDWVDANDEHRMNGAESEDYYLKLPTPYRTRNGQIESVNELLQIKGVTRELFEGVQGHPGLRDVMTARYQGQPNINTAGPVVFCAMDISAAHISSITQGRLEGPLMQDPSGKNLATTSNTFRIEADGIIEGRVLASVTAIVQKNASAGGVGIPGRGGTAPLKIVEWSGVR